MSRIFSEVELKFLNYNPSSRTISINLILPSKNSVIIYWLSIKILLSGLYNIDIKNNASWQYFYYKKNPKNRRNLNHIPFYQNTRIYCFGSILDIHFLRRRKSSKYFYAICSKSILRRQWRHSSRIFLFSSEMEGCSSFRVGGLTS